MIETHGYLLDNVCTVETKFKLERILIALYHMPVSSPGSPGDQSWAQSNDDRGDRDKRGHDTGQQLR